MKIGTILITKFRNSDIKIPFRFRNCWIKISESWNFNSKLHPYSCATICSVWHTEFASSSLGGHDSFVEFCHDFRIYEEGAKERGIKRRGVRAERGCGFAYSRSLVSFALDLHRHNVGIRALFFPSTSCQLELL